MKRGVTIRNSLYPPSTYPASQSQKPITFLLFHRKCQPLLWVEFPDSDGFDLSHLVLVFNTFHIISSSRNIFPHKISSILFRHGSRGGPRGPVGLGPPLTPGFEAPKLSIFGPYLIFPLFFFASLRSAYYFFNMLLFQSSNSKIFQPRFARHMISHLQVFLVLVLHILGY